MGGITVEYEKIKQLMEDMGSSKLTEINIDFSDGTKISMKKENVEAISNCQTMETNSVGAISNRLKAEIKQDEKEESGNIVKSPMVGTFYIKPSPTAEAYVEVGKEVKKGDVLCIIEAMKLMNEIESEYTGKVVEILVKDGDMVEYGTPLFKLAVSEH